MRAVVVDTNVMVVANGKAEQAGPGDILACVDALEKARSKQIVSIDEGHRLFDEYFTYTSHSGQPGVGDAFAKWLFENQGNAARCEQVTITPKVNDPEDFEEFPNDPYLTGLDRSDRKFVAVASVYKPRVLNATDSDWWDFRLALARHGVVVTFLCPHLVRRRRRVE